MTAEQLPIPPPPAGPTWRVRVIGYGVLAVLLAVAAALIVPSLTATRMIANQNNAGAALKRLTFHEAVWKQGDYDRNGEQDYWTRDVAGFHCVHDEHDKPLDRIEASWARADKSPAMGYAELHGISKAHQGYFFQAMTIDQDGNPYLQAGLPFPTAKNAPASACTNREHFGFTTFPDRYGQDGALVFIVNEDGVIWPRDFGRTEVVLDRKAASPDSIGSEWSQM